MRLLSLDYDPVYGGDDSDDCDRESFSSDVSVFDYDVVIWDPESTLNSYLQSDSYFSESYFKNLPRLSDHASVSLKSDISRRRSEFAEFLKSGRTVIVIVRPPQECYIATGEKRYFGTGRNQKVTPIVEKIDIWDAFPITDPQLTRAAGNRIGIDGEGAISSFLRKYKHLLRYEAVMSAPPGKPVASVIGTNRIVGSVLQTSDDGVLLLLPPFGLSDGRDGETGEMTWKEESVEVQQDLLAAIEKIKARVVEARPAWATKYSTKDQLALRDAVVKQQNRVETARAKLSTLQQKEEQGQSKDQLFLGTGRALELEVKAVLELLGGDVTEPEPGRDDWKVKFDSRNAVVEVKGVNKSAAEKHAAQLEKWVAGELEATGTAPKGILIVNTWRETDLSARTEKDFPDQMLPYCVSRDHCLMTGLQLFAIRSDIETAPSRAEYWRDKILKTAGVIEGADDWRSVLVQTDSDEG
ncbi:hypothetical protein ABZV58_16475 [Nocardia sp. NPDC004654]|uniref:hypothetical protein n=1 Tax=Nocardia sp. NPDC004654 TaxID=3154776 RepID=UPI0033BDB94A